MIAGAVVTIVVVVVMIEEVDVMIAEALEMIIGDQGMTIEVHMTIVGMIFIVMRIALRIVLRRARRMLSSHRIMEMMGMMVART
jgi:hypothetical protein